MRTVLMWHASYVGHKFGHGYTFGLFQVISLVTSLSVYWMLDYNLFRNLL